MAVLKSGKMKVFVVDLTTLESNLADRIADKLDSLSFDCQCFPGERKYKVFWDLEQPIHAVIEECTEEMVHPWE